jgi:hypothetical protein
MPGSLAFLPLSADNWRELENEFGNDRLDIFFAKISKGTKMFW